MRGITTNSLRLVSSRRNEASRMKTILSEAVSMKFSFPATPNFFFVSFVNFVVNSSYLCAK
jgi:hypothetical protein